MESVKVNKEPNDIKNKGLKSKKWIIITIVSVLTIGMGGFVLYKSKQLKINGTGISGYILGEGMQPDMTPEEIQAALNKAVDESKVAFSIYSEPIFEGKKGTIMFANPRYSAHNIDLSVTLEGSEIIKTEKISPDQYIEKISLLGKPLKKGEHKAIAVVKAYDRKTDKVMGEVAIDMIITSK